jgi:dTDP-4-amino-4,6-dideoxygalactose transaminase
MRQALIAHLEQRNIAAVFHYQSLHLSEMGLRYGGKPGDCPVTEMVSDCLLRLPCHAMLTANELDRVVSAVLDFEGTA